MPIGQREGALTAMDAYGPRRLTKSVKKGPTMLQALGGSGGAGACVMMQRARCF